MSHEARPRAEDREIAAALVHQPELVLDDRFAQFVVVDLQLAGPWPGRRILDDARDLPVAPVLERLGGCGVVAVYVDDHFGLPLSCCCLCIISLVDGNCSDFGELRGWYLRNRRS